MNDIYQEEFMNAFKRLIDETTTDALLIHDTKLEDRIDDLESQTSDHDDRIEVIDGAFTDVVDHGERIEALETKLELLEDLNNTIDRRVQTLLQMGRVKLYLAQAAPIE